MNSDESKRSGWTILRLLIIRFRDDIGLCSTCSRWRDCKDITETIENGQMMVSCSRYKGVDRFKNK